MTLKEKLNHQKRVDHIKNEISNYGIAVERDNYFSKYSAKRIVALKIELEKITKR